MRALLAKYSPSGHGILTAFEALPTEFTTVDGGPWKFGPPQSFDAYLSDGAVENHVTYLGTGVHEISHAYAGRMAFQLMVDRGVPHGRGAEAILADGEPWLVPYTDTYPAIEMDATYPDDARTFHYSVYIGPDVTANQSTQSQGAYGLLDELAAYYQGARTTVDLWPWVRDEAGGDEWVAINYAVALDAERRSYAQMKFFLLHYVLHAREHKPDVYAALMANETFWRAYADVDEAYAALAATIDELEPTVWAFASTRGVDIERRDGSILIGGHPQQASAAAPYRAVLAHLGEEPYRSMP